MRSVIRPFVTRDTLSLIAAIDAVCAEGRWMRTLRYEPTPAWEHALNDADCAAHLLLVVEDSSQVVGWCRAFPLNCQNGESIWASLGVGLLPGYRNRGLGTALVSASLDWASRARMTRITLTTRSDNHRAMHVFRKCGFILTGDENNGAIGMDVELGEKSHANF